MPVVTESQEKLLLQVGQKYAKIHVRIFEPEQSKGVVFFIHDLSGNSADFTKAANLVSASGYTVICPDLPGRGQSAYLMPRQYNLKVYMNVLAAVYTKYSGEKNYMVAQGWGSMIAVIFAATMRCQFQKIVTLDMPASWSLTEDSEATAAATDALRDFETHAQAVAYLRAKPEFATLASDEAGFLDERVVPNGDRFRFALDPHMFKFFGIDKNRVYKISKVLDGISAKIFCLYANNITTKTERDILRASPNHTEPVLIKNATAGTTFHMNAMAEILLVLGCIATPDD